MLNEYGVIGKALEKICLMNVTNIRDFHWTSIEKPMMKSMAEDVEC